jgi:hypothetical protein
MNEPHTFLADKLGSLPSWLADQPGVDLYRILMIWGFGQKPRRSIKKISQK